MYECTQCCRLFKTKTKLKSHGLRKTPCKTPTHYCGICRKGLSSLKTLWSHKAICKKRPDVDLSTEEKIKSLKEKVNQFLQQLPKNFPEKLDQLDKLFPEEGNVLLE